MRNLIVLLAIAVAGSVRFEDAILLITGAESIETLDESVIQRFQELSDAPLDINAAGRSRLLASGLFSPYQTATLLDARTSGDILSYAELSLIDGFSEEFANALRQFTVLRSRDAPAARHDSRIRGTLLAKGSARTDGAFTYGARFTAVGQRFQLCWGSRTTFSDPKFTPGTASAAFYGERWLGKVIVGDFNARFGQGLAVWSGFRIGANQTVTSFRVNPSGISPSTSFSRTLHGVAADFVAGEWTFSAAWAWPGTGIVNASRTGLRSSYGVTLTNGAASADFRFGTEGASTFGEIAYNGRISALAGCILSPRYGMNYGFVSSWRDGRSDTATGWQNRWASAVGEFVRDTGKGSSTLKFQANAAPSFTLGALTLKPSVLLKEKVSRPDGGICSFRSEVRGELTAVLGSWNLGMRYDTVWCRDRSWLWYLEPAYAVEKLGLFARFTLFKVDNWDDRIYVYERDAPGNFNVPVCYGRGWNASAVAGFKRGRRHSFWIRASYLTYPWMTGKDGKVELKLQYSLSLSPLYRSNSRE